MSFDLAAMARRQRNIRRRSITLPPIAVPATFATDLFRSCYLPVVEAWTEGATSIVAEYERSLSELTTDAPGDIERVLSALAGELSRLVLTLTPRLRDWTVRVERWQRNRWRGAVLSATGVDLLTMLGPETARRSLDQTIAWNTELIADVSAQVRQRVSSAVFSGLQERRPAREVAKQISEAVGMARSRSLRIASDQLSKLSGELADERRREAGISCWKWRHSGKRHPRETHRAREGRIYSDDPARVGTVVDGQTVAAPPPPGDLPSRPPYCGCRSQSVIVFD